MIIYGDCTEAGRRVRLLAVTPTPTSPESVLSSLIHVGHNPRLELKMTCCLESQYDLFQR